MNKMIQKRKNLKNRKGFTLIELIVVIAILGILAAILIPQFGGFQDKARETQALVDAKQVATAIDSFYAENNEWPAATAINDTSPDKTEIANLSGVAANKIAILANGGLTVTITEGSDTYTAGRLGGDPPGPVEAPMPTAAP